MHLSSKRYNSVSTSVKDLILVAGGINSTNYPVSTVDIYNTTSKTSKISNLSYARPIPAWMIAFTVLDVAVFAGGESQGLSVNVTIDVYNATTDQWETLTLPNPRT